jgi:hypothetical protein
MSLTSSPSLTGKPDLRLSKFSNTLTFSKIPPVALRVKTGDRSGEFPVAVLITVF